MTVRLTDALVKSLSAPAKGNYIAYDKELPGFGVRITAAGARSFVLTYRPRSGPNAGRQRRITVGVYPNWKTGPAREEARELKRRASRGDDPLSAIASDREAPTVADLCDRFVAEHVLKKRPSTQRDYRSMISMYIRPELGSLKVAAVSFSDITKLHNKVSQHAPYRANRCVAVLSKMLALSIRWAWRPDNPAKGIERNDEHKRARYLKPDELARLTAALAAYPDKDTADAIRLLLLTGARRGEVLGMRWDQLDMGTGDWVKPGAATKQRVEHRVPLSEPAREVLAGIRARSPAEAMFVFPGSGAAGHRRELKKAWASICKAAGISGVRIHDLRHSFASILASGGASLPLIGALLGHTQPQTTHRYTHLFNDPLRAAAEQVGAIVTRKPPN